MREFSLRNVLKTAYEKNQQKPPKRKSRETMSAEFGNTEYKNYSKKLNDILDGLYYWLNDIDQSKEREVEEQWFKEKKSLLKNLNVFRESIIIALLTMESDSKYTFISKLKNRRFDEITVDERHDYFLHVQKTIKKTLFDFSYKYLKNENDNKITDEFISKELRETINKLVEYTSEDEKNNLQQLLREEPIVDNILKQVKDCIYCVFHHKNNEHVPFIKNHSHINYKKECKKFDITNPDELDEYILMGMATNLDFNYSHQDTDYSVILEELRDEEKMYILSILEKDIQDATEKWRDKVLEAVDRRGHLEKYAIEDISEILS